MRAGSYEATPDRDLVGVRGRQVIIKTASKDASAGYRVRRRTQASGEVFERFAGDVAFEASDDLSVGSAFGSASGDVVTGSRVAAHAGQHDAVEGCVGVTVSSPVEAVPGGLA